jgi:hypothetical protein
MFCLNETELLIYECNNYHFILQRDLNSSWYPELVATEQIDGLTYLIFTKNGYTLESHQLMVVLCSVDKRNAGAQTVAGIEIVGLPEIFSKEHCERGFVKRNVGYSHSNDGIGHTRLSFREIGPRITISALLYCFERP